jgi:protease-4
LLVFTLGYSLADAKRSFNSKGGNMSSRSRVLITACVFLAAALTAGLCQGLVIHNPSPVYSYFEGMRGYYSISAPALTDDGLATWLNPPGLGVKKPSGLVYMHSYSDSTVSGDDALGVIIRNFAFGMEFMKLREPQISMDRQRVNRYTLSLGGRMGRNVYVGGSYAWLNSDICDLDRGSTWSAGILWRPHRMVSVGVLGRDLNSPTYYGTKFRPIVEASLGYRPFDERLTLFTSVFLRDENLEIRTLDGELIETQPKSFFNFGIEARPWPGINISGTYDQDGNWSLALGLPSGQGAIATAVTTEKDRQAYQNQTYGVAGFMLFPQWHESVLNPLKHYVEIDMSGHIGEAPPRFSLFGSAHRYTTRELIEQIDRAADSREVSAILMRMGNVSASTAIADELRQALTDFRKSGKKVVVYANAPENREYYLATAADYIVLAPNGYLGLNGMKLDVTFVGGTLEKIGVTPHYTRVGKYKSATEQVADRGFSEPAKEALNDVFDDFFAKFVQDIAAGRGISTNAVKSMIDKGPYMPEMALELGLVDRLAYPDEIPDIMEEVVGGPAHRLPYRVFAGHKPDRPRWDEPPVIGIVYGEGMILEGSNRDEPAIGAVMGPETLGAAFRRMRQDKNVKAVVFRIDSGGGEMSASDRIRREVELTAREKPVIVSMSGVAGSGGYHIACNATRILADETTITGSIGVINMWFHTRGLYEKLGLSREVYTRGANADIFPSWREVTEQDLEMSRYFTEGFYEKFVRDVAEGRGMDYEAVHEVGQGRIWSGKSAVEIGLTDGVGGLVEAIRLAKEEAGIPADEEVAFEILPEPVGFWDVLSGNPGGVFTPEVRLPGPAEALLEEAAYMELLKGEPHLYLMPYRIEVE